MIEEYEKEIIIKVMDRQKIKMTNQISIDKLNVQYFQQKNFMICIISHNNDVITAGVTKRNPIDNYQSEVGRKLALSNAIKNLLN